VASYQISCAHLQRGSKDSVFEAIVIEPSVLTHYPILALPRDILTDVFADPNATLSPSLQILDDADVVPMQMSSTKSI
jgi:hypothetical protein